VQGSGTGSVTGTSTTGSIDCAIGDQGSCSMTIPNTVTITATPGPGTSFVGWTGCATSTSASISVSGANANGVTGPNGNLVATCTATFQAIQVQVVVQATGSGTGTVSSSPAGVSCPPTCTASFAQNTAVTLTAVPAASSDFGGWSGGLFCPSPTNPVLTFTATASVTCTVRFDLKPTPNMTVIADDFDDAGALARWDVSLTIVGGGTATESNPPTGGASGGYREGRHDFTAFGTTTAVHILRGDATHPGTYDPAAPGAGPVDHLVVSWERIILHATNPGAQIGSFFALRQGASVYFARIDAGDAFSNLTWQSATRTLVASDFINGTPNFNAPMEFGFRRQAHFSSGTAPLFITWGTDKFRVEVWR
jgi:hypothetical protein